MNTNVTMIPVSQLHPHPDNPRKDLGDITELTASIKANGVLQNLTVVPRANPDVNYEKLCRQYYADPTEENRTKLNQFRNTDGYTVIIGHRRLAAAKAAGLMELPCIVVEDMTLEEQISTASLSTANAPKKTSPPRRPRNSLRGRPKSKNIARSAASLRRTKNPPTACG